MKVSLDSQLIAELNRLNYELKQAKIKFCQHKLWSFERTAKDSMGMAKLFLMKNVWIPTNSRATLVNLTLIEKEQIV